jgi:hypothetical protein
VIVAIAAAGCGSDPSPGGVAHLASTPTASNAGNTSNASGPSLSSGGAASQASPQTSAKIAKFAQCMRSHGVSKFPDPVGGRLELKSTPGSGLDPNSPQFKSAQDACKSLMPAGPPPGSQESKQMQATMLKFSQCVRSHGVPNFPDPTFSGNGGATMKITPDVGNSPQFKAAQQACQSMLPKPVVGAP